MRRILIIVGLVLTIASSSEAQSSGPRIHNEIDNFCCERFRSVMDEFFAEVTTHPDATGYVIIYEGGRHDICSVKRQAAVGEIDEIIRTVRNHVAFRNVDPKRFSIVDGGYRESWYAEFWIVPKGSTIPNPRPTRKSKTVKYKKRRASELNLQCP